MSAINDTKVEEFLRALTTAKQSLNRSEQILAVKPDNVLTDTEDLISTSPNTATFDDILRFDTPTHSLTATNSLGGSHGNGRGMQTADSSFGSLSTMLEIPSGFGLGANRVPLSEGLNGVTFNGTPRHKCIDLPFISHRKTTQFDTNGGREDSLERRLSELREENSRLVDQSRRGQGVVDDLKLKLRTGTNKWEQTQADLADELRQKALLQDRVAGMDSRMATHQQDLDSQRSQVSELEQQLTQRKRQVERLDLEKSAGKEEVKNLKRSYETVSRSLEQAASSQARLREALSQSREREREGGMLSEERLAQLKSAESKLFENQQQLEQSKKLVESKNQRISHLEFHSSPSDGLSAENVALKEKVLILSQQGSKFQLELSSARSQLQRMESLALRLETPSPSFRSDSILASSCKGDVDKLKIELEGKDRQIRLLEDQLTQKTYSSADHVEQLQQLQRQINTIRREKDQAKEESENQTRSEIHRLKLSHSDHTKELENQLGACGDKLNVSKREVESLRNQLAEAKGQSEALLSQNESLSNNNASLSHKLEMVKIDRCQELDSLQREAEQGGHKVRELEMSLKKCQGEVERQANHLMNSEQERRERISALELELKLSGQDLQQIMEAANNRNRELQAQIQTCSDLEEKLSHSQADWDEKLHQKEVLVSDLHAKLSESVSLNSELKMELEQQGRVAHQASREVAELRTQLATAQGENRALDQQAKLVEQVRVELIQSRDRENQLSNELSATKERVGELYGAQNQLRAALANEERLSSDLKSVRADLESERGESRQWKGRFEEQQRNLEGRARDLERKGAQIRELEQAFHKLKGDASSRASDQDRSLLQTQTEVRVQKERVTELSSEVAQLGRHIATLEEEKKRLLEQVGRHKSATRDSQDKHTQALQELQKSRRETQEYSHQLRAEKETHKSKETRLEQLKRQLATVNHRATELDRKCEQSNRALEASEKRCQNIQEETRKTIGRLGNESERLKQQLDLSSQQSVMQNQRIQEIHAQEMARHEQEMTSLRLELRQHADRQNLESREVSQLRATHTSLTADLSAERECSQRLRHSLSIKEAEVARIGARLSALERQQTMQTMRQEPISLTRTSSRSSIDTRDHPTEIPHLPSLSNFPILPDHLVSHQGSVPRIDTQPPSCSYHPASPHAVTYDAWEAPVRRERTPNRLSSGYSSSLPTGRFQETPSRQELGEGVNLSLSQLADDLAKAVSHPQPLPFLRNSQKRSPNSANQSINS